MSIRVHFLNVGDGDCTIVDHEESGRITWIDINNSRALTSDEIAELTGKTLMEVLVSKLLGQPINEASQFESLLVDPVDYWKQNFSGRTIHRFVVTHPDMDHLSGLHRLVHQEKVSITNFWTTTHTKDFTEDEFSGTRYDYRDWLTYKELLNGDHGNKVLLLHRGSTGQYWDEDGITILSPTTQLDELAVQKDDYNISSYVLLITHGDSHIILGGDADTDNAWPDIYQCVSDSAWSTVELLKASHHGRKTGYYQPAAKAMSPKHTIVSVGKKPETDASQLYAQYSSVYSTRFYGTIVARCWADGDIWLYDASGKRL